MENNMYKFNLGNMGFEIETPEIHKSMKDGGKVDIAPAKIGIRMEGVSVECSSNVDIIQFMNALPEIIRAFKPTADELKFHAERRNHEERMRQMHLEELRLRNISSNKEEINA